MGIPVFVLCLNILLFINCRLCRSCAKHQALINVLGISVNIKKNYLKKRKVTSTVKSKYGGDS